MAQFTYLSAKDFVASHGFGVKTDDVLVFCRVPCTAVDCMPHELSLSEPTRSTGVYHIAGETTETAPAYRYFRLAGEPRTRKPPAPV